MLTLLKLAFRNIFRFKRRTIITFCAVSVGLALLVIVVSLMNGIDKQSISNIIDCQTSHLKIFQEGYFDKKDEVPMDLTIPDPDRICALLKGIPGVAAVEGRVLFGVGLIKGMDELPCLGVAIPPGLDPGLFKIKESLVQGEWLEPGENKLLVGKNLADDIGLAVGDTVTLRMIASSKKEDYNWNALDLEVKGIFESGDPIVDNGRVFMPLDAAQEALSMDSAATEIVVRCDSDDEKKITALQSGIKDVLKREKMGLEVYTWKDLAGVFLVISEMKTQRSAMFIFIMLVVASMGIINTMLMSVLERTREIGMLGALGMKKSEIMKLFIFEGGFIGVIGSLLGCIMGGLVGWYLQVHGWSIASMGDGMKRMSAAIYPVKDVFYAEVTLGVLVMVFLFGAVVSVLASAYPAWKAARLDPVEALRHI